MSNEAKAVCTSQLAAFFAQGHRAATAAALRSLFVQQLTPRKIHDITQLKE
jgi:hypothetical protein